jgi:replicative DNA helicase
MNFKTAYLEGQKGRNFGLDTGLPNINKALGGVQRKSIYTVAAAPKV